MDNQDSQNISIVEEPAVAYLANEKVSLSFDDLRRIVDSLNLTQSLRKKLANYLLGQTQDATSHAAKQIVDQSEYSSAIQRLMGCVSVNPEQVEQDERLAYLLNK